MGSKPATASSVASIARIEDDGWKGGEVKLLDIGRVLPNPLNPRGEIVPETCEELAQSMRGTGSILQPLLVTPYRSAYYIVAGHRRRVAAGLAGLTKVPAIVRDIPEHEQLAIMLVENMQREGLSPLAEARSFEKLVKDYGGINQAARVTGVPSASIKNRLLLLRCDSTAAN